MTANAGKGQAMNKNNEQTGGKTARRRGRPKCIPPNPLLINVEEAADICRTSRTMFYKLNASGRTPKAVKLGSLTFWRREEILAWIEAGCPPRDKWESKRGAVGQEQKRPKPKRLPFDLK